MHALAQFNASTLPRSSRSSNLRPAAPHPPLEAAFPLHVTVGPFRVVIVHAPREAMQARRRLMEYELSRGIVWLHESLTGERLAHQFLNAIVRLVHKAAGCQTGCIEEAFTQSLAAGLVSFAQHNREVWVWFNRLLAASVNTGARFDQAASGAFRRRLCVPKVVLVDRHVVRFAPLSHAVAVRKSVDGYFSASKDGRLVELYECLHGPQRAVVFAHEVTHAIHDAARLRVRDTRARFVAAQVAGWLRFIRRNPSAWMWLLATIREQYEFEPLALLT
jgi:hypothetical protein